VALRLEGKTERGEIVDRGYLSLKGKEKDRVQGEEANYVVRGKGETTIGKTKCTAGRGGKQRGGIETNRDFSRVGLKGVKKRMVPQEKEKRAGHLPAGDSEAKSRGCLGGDLGPSRGGGAERGGRKFCPTKEGKNRSG